jgi:hypothetical protein
VWIRDDVAADHDARVRIWHFDRAGIHDFKGTYEKFSGTVA